MSFPDFSPAPSIEIVLRLFKDGSVCSCYLLLSGESEMSNRVQGEVMRCGEAIIQEFQGGAERIAALLVDEHPWVRYFAACVCLKRGHADASAVAVLEELSQLPDAVASLSEVTLFSYRSGLHAGPKH